MQAVFRLIPDHAVGPVDHFRADFLAAMRGQAMHEQGVVLGPAHQGLVDLIVGEVGQAHLAVVFVAHAGPHIREHEVGAVGGLRRVIADHRALATGLENLGVGPVALGRGDAQIEVEQTGGQQIGVAHVVAIADPGHGLAGDVAAVFLEGLKVREHLAGMQAVGEAVDHRHAGIGGEALERLVRVVADHHRIDHAREYARGVLHRLAAPDLGVLRRQEQRMAAELGHARLEGHARARGSLFEQHRQRAAGQRRLSRRLALERDRVVDDAVDAVGTQIVQAEKVSQGHDQSACIV